MSDTTGLALVSAFTGGGLAVALLWAAWISWFEEERQASVRLILTSILIFGSLGLPLAIEGMGGAVVAGVLLSALLLLGAALLAPLPGRRSVELGTPVPGVDERDIMFSRAELVPGTLRFEEYYRRCPERREVDDGFRREPGLLDEGASLFHPLGFPAADSAFWTIERLQPFVEGDEDELPEVGTEPVPADITRFLKVWLRKMGAHSVGVTRVRDYHLYTHVGRGSDYGKAVTLDHPYALALTVEMDREMVDRAPGAPTAMESALQYLRSGVMAVQVADLIRRLGYRARAHIDGNYRVICPLVAQDAGLGVLGRMGLLMTPRLGPRVRIAVITTDLPLEVDDPASDPATVDFCLRCRKCADACPSQAISLAPPENDADGVRRWKIDSESCFTFWTKVGTDCARCMAVCPYSHPDNGLHAVVRWGIRRNTLFRRGAVWMDDLIYGRRPPPKGNLPWMEVAESNRVHDRTTRQE
jgi:reductive dehalogenase